MNDQPSGTPSVGTVDGALPERRNATPLKMWRSLEELRTGRPPKERLGAIPSTFDAVTRQQFLKLMGASIALAGVTACAPPGERHIAPYVHRPPEVVQGESLYYATALTLGGYANGVLVRQFAGRPVKVEGNPQHPASLGATNIYEQGATLSLYDPDRSATVINAGQRSTWDEFASALTTAMAGHASNQGAGLAIMTETVTSPTQIDLVNSIKKRLPQVQWYQWEPVNRDNVHEGARLTFGQPLNAIYRFDLAKVILSLDSDFLWPTTPGQLRYTRDFVTGRNVNPSQPNQNRFYMLESTPRVTGANADHRLPVRALEVEGIARAIAGLMGIGPAPTVSPAGADFGWISGVAKDLQANRGASIVIAGEDQPPVVHQLAHLMNNALGNLGKTVLLTDPVEANPGSQLQSLHNLIDAMNGGKVDLLLMLGGNPVYNAPPDLNFASALGKVATSIHLSQHLDETSKLATWHVPMVHELEDWGDARAYDGTATIQQPLIEPLFNGHSAYQLLSIVNGTGQALAHDLVKSYWQRQMNNPPDFDLRWRTALNDGFIANTALPTRTAAPTSTAPPPAATNGPSPSGMEIIFQPDLTIFDGRFANNAWLQELPKPTTRLTWDNVVYLSPAMANQLSLANGDLVDLKYKSGQVRAPVWLMPGHPQNSITVHLGYGRPDAGSVGTDRGYNAYYLRTSSALWFDTGVTVEPVGATYALATTQNFQNMEGRDMVLHGTIEEFQKNPQVIQGEATKPVGTLYPDFSYANNRWGMSINLSTCIGCSACVIACQSENNIPVVGKEWVAQGRSMHWLRVDRYYQGNENDPVEYHMPVPCMQCEIAPCELVCPVDATTHSQDGLNDMVYNRCIGTRYCSNNCPYKVRRFNFLAWNDWNQDMLAMVHNPDVTVRERGVMEKCTYCVQRIRHAETRAESQGRPIQDGEVQTACQAVCPARAISFGNMNDPNSEIAKLKVSPLNYSLLGELNTRPRTTYLASIRNPNPDLV